MALVFFDLDIEVVADAHALGSGLEVADKRFVRFLMAAYPFLHLREFISRNA